MKNKNFINKKCLKLNRKELKTIKEYFDKVDFVDNNILKHYVITQQLFKTPQTYRIQDTKTTIIDLQHIIFNFYKEKGIHDENSTRANEICYCCYVRTDALARDYRARNKYHYETDTPFLYDDDLKTLLDEMKSVEIDEILKEMS